MNFSLEGKIALVTGASRGIGEAIAATLAGHGAHCILVSRKIEGLEEVVNKIKGNGGKAEAIACHMGYLGRISALFEEVKTKHGRLDILINNAAASPYYGPLIDAEEDAWDKTFDVNIKGPFFMIKQAALMMKTTGGGSIVNVSSVAGITPQKFNGIYSATKAGLISITKSFAKELACYNIRVNGLLPGYTRTKLAGTLDEDDTLVKSIPMQRAARPIEMAGAVLYLVSDEASYCTGTCLVCDGGLTV